MKHFFTFLILLTCSLAYNQTLSNQYDYFVQYNGSQLSKKINFADVLNHAVLKKYKENMDVQEFANLFKLDQKVSVHGNFSDSIPYYQVTIPIKSKEDVKAFLVKMNNRKNDSVKKFTIEDFGSFSLFNSGDKKMTAGWNDSYLVIFGLTKSFNYAPVMAQDTTAMAGDPESISMDATVEAANEEKTDETYDLTIEEPVVDTTYTDTYDANYDYERATFDSIQNIQQNKFIKMLFENGFTAPSSGKINNTADVSSWINYGSAMSSFNTAYMALTQLMSYDKFFPAQKKMAEFVKGINLDFFFDNDNARVEETIEYSKPIADIVSLINTRKINKNIFNYFPAEKPLGYMTYHINTKEMLKHFPTLMNEIFSTTVLFKEDVSIATDLIATIIDEEATATLFDGDLSLFLYDVKDNEVTLKTFEYDENYEQKEVEKTVKKSIPVFSMIFTSTHPNFADKLIQLGVRKKVLVQKGNYYEIIGTQKYGNVFILKDKDVVVIGNSIDYLFPKNDSFSKEIKKELKKNYFAAKVNIAKTVSAYSKSDEAKTSEIKTLNRLSEQFSDITLYSAKKLIDNKLKFEIQLNSSKPDRNIILQTLDLVQELGK
ncbi:hypothetical protein [Flavobacterium sp.]|uniref:hypothetical protein n=1 Tax=Flavobacterium sp. TaxID=239 RepID=UPI0032647EAC